MALLFRLAVVMLLASPLARSGEGPDDWRSEDPWDAAGGWVWLLPAVLAILAGNG